VYKFFLLRFIFAIDTMTLSHSININKIRIKNENLKRINKKIHQKQHLFYHQKITEEKLAETFNSYNAFFANYNVFKIKSIIFDE